MDIIISWISENWIELAAAGVSIVYVILSIKQIIWLWFFGILSAVLYAWVYGHSGFYAGMSLQAYYAVMSIYGWIHWSYGSKEPDTGGSLPVIRASNRLLVTVIVIWLLLLMIIGFFLQKFTDSTIPFWDAFTASGGIIATWMLARKILEQWLLWIVIDLVSVVLYLWQGLYATTLLFLVYVVMAIVGYLQWRKAWMTKA